MIDLDEVRARLNNNRVKFEEDGHKYTIDGRRLINVGSYVGKFKHQFDADYWAEKKAKQRGIAKEAVLAEWRAKGEIAANNGTALHQYAKLKLTGGRCKVKTEKARAFDDWWATANKSLVPVACEVVLFDEEAGVSGTADFIAYSSKTEKLHVFDWKTNEKFTTESSYRKWLLPPFDNMPECALSEYSLQVSLYKVLARAMTEEEFGHSFIVHIGNVATPHRAIDVSDRLEDLLCQ